MFDAHDPTHALDETKRAQFCAIVGIGCSRRVAADYLGFHLRTVRKAIADDETFRRQVHEAESKPRAHLVRDPAARHKCGRPTALDSNKRSKVLMVLRLGCPRATAAAYVGCAESTLSSLIHNDPEFRRKVFEAEAQHEVLYKKRLDVATEDPRYWRAVAWAMERKFPQTYALQKPETLTTVELARALRQFGEIVADEVRDAELGQRIVVRLGALTTTLGRVAGLIGHE